MNEYDKTEIDSDTENKLGVTRGEGVGGGAKQVKEIKKYKLLLINKAQGCNTQHRVQLIFYNDSVQCIISKNIKYVVPPKLMLCCNTSIILKSFKLFIYLFLTVLGRHCSTGFSLVAGKQGLLSSCGAPASHRGGFSCCRAQALGLRGFSSCGTWVPQLQLPGSRVQAQQLWPRCLVASQHMESSPIRDQTYVSFIGR